MPQRLVPFVGPRVPMSPRNLGDGVAVQVWRRKIGQVTYDFHVLPQVGDGSQIPARVRVVREIHDPKRAGAIVRNLVHDLPLKPVSAAAEDETEPQAFWPPQKGDVWLGNLGEPIPLPLVCGAGAALYVGGDGMPAERAWNGYGPLKLVWRGGSVVTAMHSSELSA